MMNRVPPKLAGLATAVISGLVLSACYARDPESKRSMPQRVQSDQAAAVVDSTSRFASEVLVALDEASKLVFISMNKPNDESQPRTVSVFRTLRNFLFDRGQEQIPFQDEKKFASTFETNGFAGTSIKGLRTFIKISGEKRESAGWDVDSLVFGLAFDEASRKSVEPDWFEIMRRIPEDPSTWMIDLTAMSVVLDKLSQKDPSLISFRMDGKLTVSSKGDLFKISGQDFSWIIDSYRVVAKDISLTLDPATRSLRDIDFKAQVKDQVGMHVGNLATIQNEILFNRLEEVSP